MLKTFTKFIFSIGTIIVITLFIFLSDFLFNSTHVCGLYSVTFDCDLSGWMGLIFGDMMISFSLALFWRYLSKRSNAKIEANSQAIKNNSVTIQKILTKQQETQHRRQTYVIQSFKNHFSALLLFIGVIENFSKNTSQNKNYKTNLLNDPLYKTREFESILQKFQNILNLSIDVIDPMLVGQIEQFLMLAQQNVSQNIEKNTPLNHDTLKDNIIQLTNRLNDYSDIDKVLK